MRLSSRQPFEAVRLVMLIEAGETWQDQGYCELEVKIWFCNHSISVWSELGVRCIRLPNAIGTRVLDSQRQEGKKLSLVGESVPFPARQSACWDKTVVVVLDCSFVPWVHARVGWQPDKLFHLQLSGQKSLLGFAPWCCLPLLENSTWDLFRCRRSAWSFLFFVFWFFFLFLASERHKNAYLAIHPQKEFLWRKMLTFHIWSHPLSSCNLGGASVSLWCCRISFLQSWGFSLSITFFVGDPRCNPRGFLQVLFQRDFFLSCSNVNSMDIGKAHHR